MHSSFFFRNFAGDFEKSGYKYSKIQAIMVRTTFNRLRAVKDSLPHGSMDAIGAELGIPGDEVRSYFNGSGNADYHIEPGPEGGIVVVSNTRILEVALRRAWEAQNAL